MDNRESENISGIFVVLVIIIIIGLSFLMVSFLSVLSYQRNVTELHNNTPDVFDAPVPFLFNTHPDDYKNCILVSKNDTSMTIECDSGFIGSRVSTLGSGVKRGYVYCGIPDYITFERVW